MNSRDNQKQNNSNSLTMDLENLQQKYTNLLAQYKSAVYEYTNFLSEHASEFCSKYNADSKNIDQSCYDYIWSRSGCKTTGIVNANTDWAKSQTLNGLIYDSFLWATMTDSQHRQGCYGDSTDYSSATEPDYKINKPKMVSIKGHSFNGTGLAGQIDASTLQDCEAACANLSSCTGATFVSNKCLLRAGDSPIVSSNEDSYAIVPKAKQLLLNMEDINQQLIAINKQIVSKINVIKPVYNRNVNESANKNQKLIDNYKNLMEERENILELLRQYETLDSVENQHQIKINQNYYSYILLAILAIAIVFLLFKISLPSTVITNLPAVQYGGELGINAYYILFSLILLTIGIHYYFKYFP